MHALAIIILNYKSYKMTLRLVASLQNLCAGRDARIVVVDNASPNESAAELEKKRGELDFVLLRSERNAGYAAGNNIGLRWAQEQGYAYSLVLNNDIEIQDYDQIKNMISLIEQDERIGAVSPRIVGADGKKDPPIYFKKPSFLDLSFGLHANTRERFRFDENRNRPIYAPRGSCMLLRNSAAAEVGNLDEHTFLYYEEPILAERLASRGYSCWLCGESCVVHNHAVTIRRELNKSAIIQRLCESYAYYLSAYRGFNRAQIALCLAVRKLAILRRR